MSVTGTFDVTPSSSIYFGGSLEAAKIRDFVNSAQSTYTVVSVSTSDFIKQTQHFVLQAQDQVLLDGAITNLQTYMPDLSIGHVLYEAISEGVSDAASGAVNSVDAVTKAVGKGAENILKPVVTTLSLPLIVAGILGVGFIVYQSGYKVKGAKK